MTDNIFREYDIRGIVGKEIDIENVGDLTKSILTFFLKENPSLSEIIIGMDGRTHSPQMKTKVIDACCELGIDVTDIGICPTPVFYFSLFNTNISSGLMITASHNPKEYNGIKICLNKKSVWGNQIREIRKIFRERNFAYNTNNNQSKVTHYDVVTPYLDWMCDHFKHLQNKDINTIIDCGNGTAGVVFPRLIKMMGWKNTKLLFEEVDGTFPNHEADPTNPENMVDVKHMLLKDDSYDIGLGLDGDCDRMNPMTKSGYLVPGDKLLALYSKKIIKNHPQASIVFDIKSSDTLIEALKIMGAKPCIAPSGHSIVKEHLYKKDAKLAGELSCHFFFNDRYFGYDDGIYAALRLFELLDEQKDETLDEMLKKLPKRVSSPEYRISCDEEIKSEIVEHVKKVFAAQKDTEMLTIDGLRATTPYGWGLIRASNTQPVICLRFESDTQSGLQKLQQNFTDALKPYFDEKKLKEYFGE